MTGQRQHLGRPQGDDNVPVRWRDETTQGRWRRAINVLAALKALEGVATVVFP